MYVAAPARGVWIPPPPMTLVHVLVLARFSRHNGRSNRRIAILTCLPNKGRYGSNYSSSSVLTPHKYHNCIINNMALRLACQRLLPKQQLPSASASVAARLSVVSLRSFAAEASPALQPGAEAPSVFDSIIRLTIVDPSGARRKINGMVGECYY